MNPHTSLAIAQIVFYVPAAIVAIRLMIRNWAYGPRMAWWPMVSLSLIRLTGGAITIALEGGPRDVGLIIATIVLLNVGAIPLIVANQGQVRIITLDSLGDRPIYANITKVLRIVFLIATGLLVAGSSVVSDSPNIAKGLSLAGYIVFAGVLCCLIAMELLFLTRMDTLIPSSRRVLIGSLLAAPFIILRNVYGILEIAYGYSSDVWSPLYGNVAAFALMALLCEYIAICIWFYVGFSMPPDRGVRPVRAGERSHSSRKVSAQHELV